MGDAISQTAKKVLVVVKPSASLSSTPEVVSAEHQEHPDNPNPEFADLSGEDHMEVHKNASPVMLEPCELTNNSQSRFKVDLAPERMVTTTTANMTKSWKNLMICQQNCKIVGSSQDNKDRPWWGQISSVSMESEPYEWSPPEPWSFCQAQTRNSEWWVLWNSKVIAQRLSPWIEQGQWFLQVNSHFPTKF